LKRYSRVGVVGHYWTQNFGDILLRDLMVSYLQKVCGIPTVETITRYDYQVAGGKLGKLWYLVSFPFRCDFVVFGGGGYLETGSNGYNNTHMLAIMFLQALILRLTFKKFCISGVGVGPNVGGIGGFLIRCICEMASHVTVRDDASQKLLQGLGVKNKITSLSDAALVVADNFERSGVVKNRVALHLVLRNDEYAVLEERLLELIHAVPEHIDLHIISDHGPIGQEKYLAEKCKRTLTIVECTSAEEFIQFLSSCELVVTTKLHVGIVSYALGTGIYNIYRHPKCLRFYEQIGLVDRCVPMRGLDWNNIERISALAANPNLSKAYDQERRKKVLLASREVS
jgi:polysaccharide pyruvyl transferase WcaK-like protein